MNVAMEQTEEYVNGKQQAKYGDTFIRGNNGIFFVQFFTHFFSLLYKRAIIHKDGIFLQQYII